MKINKPLAIPKKPIILINHGWQVADAENKSQVEATKVQEMFMEKLDVDEDIASILAREGFATVEEIAYVPLQELVGIDEFDEEIVEALRQRAKEVMSSHDDRPQPAKDLLEMKGMDQTLAYILAERGIKTMEDLAELSVDELLDIEGMTEKQAGTLIMTAREPWFKD